MKEKSAFLAGEISLVAWLKIRSTSRHD